VVNPDRKQYNAPLCRVCGDRKCENCPLPIDRIMTLGELIEKTCHTTKFNNNANLFKNVSTLKDLDTDSDKEEEKKNNNNNNGNSNNNNKLGFVNNYNSINQNNSDDDDDNIYTDNKYS
jgi:hypothetical protein